MSNNRMSDPLSTLPETGSGSPGSILRRCREFHGITLEEASETTKIGISHLRALEDDQIREFANKAYLKGFLRIYATYLGLNSDDISRLYDKLFGVQNETPDPTTASVKATSPQKRLVLLKKISFPALLLVLILITATFFNRPPAPPVRIAQPTAVAVPSVPGIAVQVARSSAQHKKRAADPPPILTIEKRLPEAPAGEKPVPLKRAVDRGNGLILKVKATQNGTLSATIDGSGAQLYELTIGDVIEWKAEKKVALEVNNAGGIDIELNGKPYKLLGTPGKPAYIEFDADGVKQ